MPCHELNHKKKKGTLNMVEPSDGCGVASVSEPNMRSSVSHPQNGFEGIPSHETRTGISALALKISCTREIT